MFEGAQRRGATTAEGYHQTASCFHAFGAACSDAARPNFREGDLSAEDAQRCREARGLLKERNPQTYPHPRISGMRRKNI